jgi:hypothetical protein
VKAPAKLGPCWWEHCTRDGVDVVRGIPTVPGVEAAIATAARVTRVGLVVCDRHLPMARRLAVAS